MRWWVWRANKQSCMPSQVRPYLDCRVLAQGCQVHWQQQAVQVGLLQQVDRNVSHVAAVKGLQQGRVWQQ